MFEITGQIAAIPIDRSRVKYERITARSRRVVLAIDDALRQSQGFLLLISPEMSIGTMFPSAIELTSSDKA